MLEIAVDIGGTFTDLAVYDLDSGAMAFGKVLTTPPEQSRGVGHALDAAACRSTRPAPSSTARPSRSTPSSSATGARTALITTAASATCWRSAAATAAELQHLLPAPAAARAARAALRADRADERAGRRPRAAAPGRAGRHRGARWRPPTSRPSRSACSTPTATPPTRRPWRPRCAERWPRGAISVSHALSREFREYERTSTTVVNAYVAPRVQRYLAGIEALLAERRFRGPFYVVESNAGISTAAAACASGPSS